MEHQSKQDLAGSTMVVYRFLEPVVSRWALDILGFVRTYLSHELESRTYVVYSYNILVRTCTYVHTPTAETASTRGHCACIVAIDSLIVDDMYC